MSTHNRMPKSFNAVPKPFNFQSTQQSPSFNAVKAPGANGNPRKLTIWCVFFASDLFCMKPPVPFLLVKEEELRTILNV